MQKSYFLWEFQVETLYLCTKCTKSQLEILNINVVSGIVYFRKIISECLRSVSETTPCISKLGHTPVGIDPVIDTVIHAKLLRWLQ